MADFWEKLILELPVMIPLLLIVHELRRGICLLLILRELPPSAKSGR